MNSAVWLFFGLSSIVSIYTTYRITSWFYKRKIKKIGNKHAASMRIKDSA